MFGRMFENVLKQGHRGSEVTVPVQTLGFKEFVRCHSTVRRECRSIAALGLATLLAAARRRTWRGQSLCVRAAIKLDDGRRGIDDASGEAEARERLAAAHGAGSVVFGGLLVCQIQAPVPARTAHTNSPGPPPTDVASYIGSIRLRNKMRN